MKKIIVGIAVATLFFGCNSADEPVETPDEMPVVEAPIVDETPMSDELFVAISAEILCLPMNYEDATADAIEIFARDILDAANVGEMSFANYQKKIELEDDGAKKEQIALAIVGKMEDFCTLSAPTSKSEEAENESEEMPEEN